MKNKILSLTLLLHTAHYSYPIITTNDIDTQYAKFIQAKKNNQKKTYGALEKVEENEKNLAEQKASLIAILSHAKVVSQKIDYTEVFDEMIDTNMLSSNQSFCTHVMAGLQNRQDSIARGQKTLIKCFYKKSMQEADIEYIAQYSNACGTREHEEKISKLYIPILNEYTKNNMLNFVENKQYRAVSKIMSIPIAGFIRMITNDIDLAEKHLCTSLADLIDTNNINVSKEEYALIKIHDILDNPNQSENDLATVLKELKSNLYENFIYNKARVNLFLRALKKYYYTVGVNDFIRPDKDGILMIGELALTDVIRIICNDENYTESQKILGIEVFTAMHTELTKYDIEEKKYNDGIKKEYALINGKKVGTAYFPSTYTMNHKYKIHTRDRVRILSPLVETMLTNEATHTNIFDTLFRYTNDTENTHNQLLISTDYIKILKTELNNRFSDDEKVKDFIKKLILIANTTEMIKTIKNIADQRSAIEAIIGSTHKIDDAISQKIVYLSDINEAIKTILTPKDQSDLDAYTSNKFTSIRDMLVLEIDALKEKSIKIVTENNQDISEDIISKNNQDISEDIISKNNQEIKNDIISENNQDINKDINILNNILTMLENSENNQDTQTTQKIKQLRFIAAWIAYLMQLFNLSQKISK
jgi:hypothetical protein